MELSGFTSVEARERFAERYAEVLAARWPVYTRSIVETSVGPTAVYGAGAGPACPAVLLPGGSGNAVTWAPLLPALTNTRPVFAVDVLGEAGGSTQTAPLSDAQARADWLDEVLAGIGVERVHLIGLSAGATIALAQAVHAPDRLASVVALEPARALARVSMGFWLRLIAVLVTGSSRRAEAYLRWCRAGREVPVPMRDLLVAGLVEHRSRAVPPPSRLSDEQLRSITLPMLIALGAESPIHRVGHAARRGRLIPNAQVRIVAGAAHGLLSECPEEVGNIVSAFLAETDDPANTWLGQ